MRQVDVYVFQWPDEWLATVAGAHSLHDPYGFGPTPELALEELRLAYIKENGESFSYNHVTYFDMNESKGAPPIGDSWAWAFGAYCLVALVIAVLVVAIVDFLRYV